MIKILTTLLILVSFSFDTFSQERIDSLYPIRINNKWGYINSFGKIVIKPIYYQADYFKNGIAEVIDSNEIQTYINLKEEIIYKHYEITRDIYHNFSENLLAVYDTNKLKWGYIGTNGKWKIKPKYYSARDFHEGLAVVCENANVQSDGGFCGAESSHPIYGVIDKRGKYVIKPKFSDLSNFYNGFAFYDDTCVINTKGQLVRNDTLKGEKILDRQFEYNYALKRIIIDKNIIDINFDDFYLQEQLFYFWNKKDNKYGFIDRYGTVVCKEIYDHVGRFNENLCSVEYQGGWGYIDANCILVIEPKFDNAFDFNEGYAIVSVNKLYGVINRKGEFVIQPKYEIENKYSRDKKVVHNLATFIKDGKSILINTKNEIVWQE